MLPGQNIASHSNRGVQGRGHRPVSNGDISAADQPSSQLTVTTTTEHEQGDNVSSSNQSSVLSRRQDISATAPSIPLWQSRHSDNHDIKFLLLELSKITCPQNDKRVCAICLESLANASATVGPCCHPLHTACLTLWLKKSRNRSCPVCRTTFSVNGGTGTVWFTFKFSTVVASRSDVEKYGNKTIWSI